MALLVREIGSQDATDGAAAVCNAQEVKGPEAILSRQDSSAAGNVLFDTDAFPLGPVFEVEEDGVEAEEDETHGCDEPSVGSVVECRRVDPDLGL